MKSGRHFYGFKTVAGAFTDFTTTPASLLLLLQLLAGPAFIVTFTISGVLMGFLADRCKLFHFHKNLVEPYGRGVGGWWVYHSVCLS